MTPPGVVRGRGHADAAVALVIAFAGFVALGARDGALGVAWPSMQASFGQPISALGLLVIAGVAGYLFASTLSARITARVGIAWQLIAGTGAAVLALVGFVLIAAWPLLVAAALLLGAGAGALDVGANAYVALRYQGIRTMNLLHTSYGVGAALGPLLVTVALAIGSSWRAAYAVLLGVQVLLLLAFVMSRHRWGVDGVAATDAEPIRTGQPGSPRGTLALTVSLFFMCAGVEAGTGEWSYSLLASGNRVSAAVAGLLVTGFWVAFTGFRLLAAFAGSRVTPTRLLDLSAVAIIAGALLLTWFPNTAAAALSLVLIGGGLAAFFPTLVALTPARVGRLRTSAVVGYQLTGGALGASLLPAAMGVVMQRTSTHALGPLLTGASVMMLVLHVGLTRREQRARRSAQGV